MLVTTKYGCSVLKKSCHLIPNLTVLCQLPHRIHFMISVGYLASVRSVVIVLFTILHIDDPTTIKVFT